MLLQGAVGSQTAVALPSWLVLDETTGELTLAAETAADAVGTYTLAVTASDTTTPTALTAVHTVVLTVAPDRSEPLASAGLPNRIAPATGESLVLDLTNFITDLQEDGSTPGVLTFEVSDSIDDAMMDENIVTAELTGSMLTLTPGTAAASGGLWEQETVTITATDTDGQKLEVSFAVSTRANVLDTGSLAPAHGFILEGEEGETLGVSVSGAGDVNGDGLDDLILFTDQGGSSIPNRVGVIYGQAGTDGTQFGEVVTISVSVSVSVDTADSTNTKTTTITETITTQDAPEGSVVRRVVKVSELAAMDAFLLQTSRSGDDFGSSVSGAGDINGDGLADLIVGASRGNDGGTRTGAAYIVYGKAGPDGTQFGVREVVGADGMTTLLDAETDVPADAASVRRVVDTASLPAADGFILQGEEVDERLGWSVSGAGDVNGDGISDLIVGAPVRGCSSDPGRAYIIYGKAGTTGTQFGEAVTIAVFAREIHGFTSVVTQTVTEENPAPTSAEVSERQVVDVAKLSPAAGFILLGDMSFETLGWSVSGAGDVNGDGLADLIVGAAFGDDGGNGAGEAYIIYGKAGNGAQFGEALTISVSVDTEDSSNNETTTITEGPAPDGSVVRQILDTTALAPADGFILQGDVASDNLGYSVSGAGDVNGDGLDDLIVGAWTGNDGGGDAGEAYIIYGKAGPDGTQFGMAVRLAADGTTTITDGSMPDGSVVRQVLDTSSLAPSDGFILQGDAASDAFGRSVAVAGDVNGDGLADLIVGAYLGDDGGMDAGEAYILYGKAGTDGTQFGTAVQVTAMGVTINDGMTTTVTETMVDGMTTMVDVEVAVPDDVLAASLIRQVLDTTDLAPTDGFILQGDAAADWLGDSVSGAGDINGDGFDDLIVGARQGDDGGNNAGEAYVIYGGAHLGEVVTHAQTLTGMAGDEFLLGGAGDDRLEAHADTEVLYGGAGDDVLELADSSFRHVDGGSGDDRLVLGMDVELDLTEATVRGKVRGIETLSLSDGAEATLDLLSVYALVESRDNGGTHTSAGEAFLRLEGVGMVALEGGTWTPTPDADGPDLYAQGSAKLLIDDGLIA